MNRSNVSNYHVIAEHGRGIPRASAFRSVIARGIAFLGGSIIASFAFSLLLLLGCCPGESGEVVVEDGTKYKDQSIVKFWIASFRTNSGAAVGWPTLPDVRNADGTYGLNVRNLVVFYDCSEELKYRYHLSVAEIRDERLTQALDGETLLRSRSDDVFFLGLRLVGTYRLTSAHKSASRGQVTYGARYY